MSDLYQAQRAMRKARQAAMQRGVVAILDVGTFKTACLVLRFDEALVIGDDQLGALAGQARFRVIGAATTRSRGVRFGEVDTMPETERAIRTAVQAAQKMANVRVDHVIACFSGGRPRSYGLVGQVAMDGGAVSEQDIARVLSACEAPDIGDDRIVLHAQPVNFALDNRSGLSDPRGQIGNHLQVDMHMLSVDAHVVDNLLRCIHRCDLELAGLASAAYMSGSAALVEDEQELGAACIDMGAGSTSVSIFMRKHMIYNDTVRMGGEHVTSDISKGLHIPYNTAERLKTRFGGLVATGMDDREVIELEGNTGDWEHDRRTVTRAELIGVMRPRVEEILEEVRAVLDDAGFHHLPGQRIVLTGGGSQIPGLDGLAAKYLGNQVRLGRPQRIQGLPQAATGPAFSGCVGLCLSAAHPQDEWWDFDITTDRAHTRSLKVALRWFKENW
jgi:cell division protein FtsA